MWMAAKEDEALGISTDSRVGCRVGVVVARAGFGGWGFWAILSLSRVG